ncbi:MAG: 30S ribosome-binding factor RbfA [Gemmatimonadales bacterium]
MRHRSQDRGRRPRRAAEQVRQVVTAFLHGEARDPRIGLVTVTKVEMTPDLQHATINYVVHGSGEQQAQTAEGLAAAAAAIRRKIGQEIELRVVPEIVFVLDKGHEHAARIEQLLAELKKPEEPPA